MGHREQICRTALKVPGKGFQGQSFHAINCNSGQKGKMFPTGVNKYHIIISIIFVCKS